ncbi:flavin-containing monooxygenase [Rhizobium tubonense]|uniref:Thioredoxin reductase n=1 Tax=Rhizobium tubonense TaxID=484088 RepID=A0A2W4EQ47_9HYPH|nr:NAD(P)/FAD-dependent oxidoreductase [Rhizobium tubonense]PZM15606.1 thioredoxin reductase [Rhizobium tubonense]
MTTEETIIIGAGPAGLACAAALSSNGRRPVVLEAADRPAASWHRHYDRLHLHTSKAHSALPGKPMPADFPRYPSRLQIIAYLEDYARTKDLRIFFGRQAVSVRRAVDWMVETANGDLFESRSVIIATGLSNTPIRPEWHGQNSFMGPILHSSEYRNASALKARRVLVVGFGNSAGEIALECAEAGLDVAMSVRGPVNVVGREMFGIPSATIAIALSHFPHEMADGFNAPFLRLRYGDLERFGLRRAGRGPLTTMIELGRTPLIDVGTIAKIREGRIKVFPGVERLEGSVVHFEDRQSIACDAIILATGYRPNLEEVLPDLWERFPAAGRPASGDLHPAGDGLYFCGYNAATTGLLRQIGIEAQKIASSIARRHQGNYLGRVI